MVIQVIVSTAAAAAAPRIVSFRMVPASPEELVSNRRRLHRHPRRLRRPVDAADVTTPTYTGRRISAGHPGADCNGQANMAAQPCHRPGRVFRALQEMVE